MSWRFEVRVNYCGPSGMSCARVLERSERENTGRRERKRERRNAASAWNAFGADSFVGFPHPHAPTRSEPLKKPSSTSQSSPPVVKSRNSETRTVLYRELRDGRSPRHLMPWKNVSFTNLREDMSEETFPIFAIGVTVFLYYFIRP